MNFNEWNKELTVNSRPTRMARKVSCRWDSHLFHMPGGEDPCTMCTLHLDRIGSEASSPIQETTSQWPYFALKVMAEVTYFFPSKTLWFVRPTFNDPKVLFTCDEQVSLCVDVAHVCIIKVACHCPQQFSGLQYCWFLVIWYQKNTISSHAHLSFRRRALRSLLGTETFASSSSVASMTCCNIRIAPSPIPTIGFTTALTNAWFIVV